MDRRISAVAPLEWLLVLPATVFLGVAAVRSMAGRGLGFQLSEGLLRWTAEHMSRAGAAVIFLAMPVAVLTVGAVTLIGRWRRDAPLRADVASAIQMIRRNAIVAMVTTATCLGAGIFVAVVIHIITD
jgi:hypothetical protein